jgi:predicted ATPase/DNA-binding winged helix-turn-helix (wHTH) protein
MDHSDEYLFGPYRLNPRRQELSRDGMPVSLGSRSIDLLWVLVEAEGALVTKQALFDRVWPRHVNADGNVWVAVSAVRKALGLDADGKPYIVSVAGRGYRFAAPVTRVAAPEVLPVPLASPAVLPPEMPSGNLPEIVAPLIGRDAEIARALALLDRSKLLTIIGTGGVGKTRMALALGDAARGRHGDGVWLVELASLATPELVPETIAALLGLSVQGSRTAIEVVASYLRQKDILLILDNCEHVVTEAARVAEAILRNCAQVTILATSREPLRISGEQSYRLPSLGLPDQVEDITAAVALDHAAIRLFVARAELAVENFALTDETAPVVAALCRRLDGIPLALELAAARLRVLNPRELLDRLDRRFGLLSGGSRTVLPRHQTLTALIDWSWDHLAESERILFARLAVFGGSFTLESAEAVAGAAPLAGDGILELLAGLVDKSLVTADDGGTGTRYRMLETTRSYAADRLGAEEAAANRRRLALRMAAALGTAQHDYQRMPTRGWLDAWVPELDNLRAALDWAFGPSGEPGLGIELVAGAIDLWYEASLVPEMRRAVGQAKAALAPDTPPVLAGQVLLASVLAEPGAAIKNAEADGRRALEFARSAGDPRLLGRTLAIFGSRLFNPASPDESEELSRQAIALLQPFGPTKELAFAHTAHGISLHLAGTGDPRPDYLIASELARGLGDQRRVNIAAQNLAEYTFVLGDHAGAVAAAREAAAAARSLGMRVQTAFCELNLGGYLLVAGATAEGALHARTSLAAFASMGIGTQSGIALQHLALALVQSGDCCNAARLLGAADAVFVREGYAREPTERVTHELLCAALDAGLDAGERDRLLAEGDALDIEAATALAAGLGL